MKQLIKWRSGLLLGGPYTTLAGTQRAPSPASSPTKVSLSHSAQASPTNTLRPCRPRARSADESNKKVSFTLNEFPSQIPMVVALLLDTNLNKSILKADKNE